MNIIDVTDVGETYSLNDTMKEFHENAYGKITEHELETPEIGSGYESDKETIKQLEREQMYAAYEEDLDLEP
ncbi:MAG: hypothetical protein R3Y67_09835 [Eubacteriales bacterium]